MSGWTTKRRKAPQNIVVAVAGTIMVFYNEEAMSKKHNKQNADPRQMQPQTAPAGGSGRFIAVGLLVLGAGLFLYAVSSETTPTPRASSDNRSASVAVRPEPAAGRRPGEDPVGKAEEAMSKRVASNSILRNQEVGSGARSPAERG